jgi:signal transduction histidine kinase
MTILIVEDIANNRKLLRAVLEGEGLTVLEANDGVAALAVLGREKVDAIIADILMPNMDGYRLCYEVRASPRFCHLPFIIYTATYTAGSDQKLSLQLGADKFLIKPSPAKNIVAALNEIMNSPQRRRFKPTEPPGQLNLMKEYNERLVAKLEEKNLELGVKVETLVQSEKELRRIQNQLEQTNHDLVKKSEEIQYFYHTLSHELKTPLTSAREFVSIVMDGLAGDLNPTQTEYLRIAKESCTQLALYINDLLDATRLETGKLHVELKPVSLPAIIQRALAIIRPAATAKRIGLNEEIDPELVDGVMVDENRILQILTNLLNNAIKFTPPDGHIAVKLSPDPKSSERVQISVTDTGCGIAPDELDRVFDRLYQVKAGNVTSEGGIGLGLYLCHELVALHGGEIWVESEMGKGSTFSFVIPKQAARKCSHVLIVDDDPGIREALRLVLEEKDFEVTTAEGGREALELISQKAPHVVILDLRMTGLDGPSTLAEIKKNWAHIPVIVHTGYPDSELLEKAMESSPFTLLSKPCPAERFVHAVERVCRDHNGQFLKRNGAVPKMPGPISVPDSDLQPRS